MWVNGHVTRPLKYIVKIKLSRMYRYPTKKYRKPQYISIEYEKSTPLFFPLHLDGWIVELFDCWIHIYWIFFKNVPSIFNFNKMRMSSPYSCFGGNAKQKLLTRRPWKLHYNTLSQQKISTLFYFHLLLGESIVRSWLSEPVMVFRRGCLINIIFTYLICWNLEF